MRKAAAKLPHVAYRHVVRTGNVVSDDMGRRALAAKKDVVYWDGRLPEDAPANQVEVCYRDATEDEEPWLRLPPGVLQGTDWEKALDTVAAAWKPDEAVRKLLSLALRRGCEKEAKRAIEARIQAGILKVENEDDFFLQMNKFLEEDEEQSPCEVGGVCAVWDEKMRGVPCKGY